MKKHKRLLAALACFCGFAAVTDANAVDSFQGSVWSLTYSGLALPDSDLSHETYRITLGVDLAGYNGGGSFLDEVAIKVSNSLTSAVLYDAPGGPTAWVLQPGGINSAGCSGSGSGFECADSAAILNSGLGVAATNVNPLGIDYSWVFDITVNNGALLTAVGADSVKARFVNSSGTKVGALVSEPITLSNNFFVSSIPEPGTYALMLSGLGLLAGVARRKSRV